MLLFLGEYSKESRLDHRVSLLPRPWLEPGLLRSCHGGQPRPVQQSPPSDIETIAEENELNETIRPMVKESFAFDLKIS